MLVSGLSFCSNIYSQNIIEQLKQFYLKADMDCYLPKIQNNVNDYLVLDNKSWRLDKYDIPPQKIEINKNETFPMLTIQFVNTDSFNFNDNIYNYITVDTIDILL